MGKKGVSKEMEAISGLFLSKEAALRDVGKSAGRGSNEGVEFEEVVSVRKKKTFPCNRGDRQAMQRELMALLEDGYVLTRAELRKTTDVLEPGKKLSRKEEVTLILKE